MMKDFLGQDKFMKGITYYLNKYKFGNAVTADLWNALSEVRQ
jgi:aminopeptidase 2